MQAIAMRKIALKHIIEFVFFHFILANTLTWIVEEVNSGSMPKSIKHIEL